MTVAFRPPLVLVARAVGLLVTALVASACLAAPAQADELADFETARALYEAQRYPESVECLERLLAGDAAQRLNRAILLEARKYLAAGFLFVSRPAEAEREFALLLAVDPEYQLDSGLFPAEIRVVFTRARESFARSASAPPGSSAPKPPSVRQKPRASCVRAIVSQCSGTSRCERP